MSKFETDYVCLQSSMILGECMRRRHEQSVHAYTIFALAYPPETGNGTRNVQTRLHSVTYILRTYYCIITWWIGLVENHHATNVYCTIQIYVLNVPGISYFSIYYSTHADATPTPPAFVVFLLLFCWVSAFVVLASICCWIVSAKTGTNCSSIP